MSFEDSLVSLDAAHATDIGFYSVIVDHLTGATQKTPEVRCDRTEVFLGYVPERGSDERQAVMHLGQK